MAKPLGAWMPDLAEHGHDGLVLARNTYFRDGAYRPIKGLSAFTASLGQGWKGGGYFKGTGGNTALLAGANAGLYAYGGSSWTLKSSGSYTQPWFFNQFGDKVICTNGAAPLKYTLTSGAAAALGGSPPTSSMSAIVDPGFVFLAGNSSNTNRVYWSGLEDPEGWTAGTNQSDFQDLPEGGPVTGLAGGDYGLAFQADAIHLFSYVGGSVIFERRHVSREIGCICHGSIAQAGNRTYFLDSRGFYVYQVGGEPVPIGKSRVDQTFLKTYSLAEIQNSLRAAVDPDRSLVIWSMPGRLWIYNWDQDRWTDVLITGSVGVSTGATSSVTLETIAATYPTVESVPVSFDDPSWQGGQPVLLVVKSDNILYSLGAATNLDATFKLPNIELFPGREAHVRNMQLIGDNAGATVSLDARQRLNNSPINTATSSMQPNGDIPIRSSGRYQQPQFTIPSGTDWTFLQAYEIEAQPGGSL